MLTVDFSDNLTGFDVKSVSKITLECQLTTLEEFSELASLAVVVLILFGHGVQQIVLLPFLTCISPLSHGTIIFVLCFPALVCVSRTAQQII